MKQFSSLLLVFYSISGQAQETIHYTLQVNQPPALMADAGDAVNTSGNEFNLGGDPTASGGTATYTYLWNPGNGLNDPAISNPVLQANQTGYYRVLVTDQKACTASDSVLITLTSIENDKQISNIQIIQNGSQLQIKAACLITSIYLTDLSGRIYLSQTDFSSDKKLKLEVGRIPAGIYFIILNTSNGPIRKNIFIHS